MCGLARLAVRRVLAAPAAVLAQLETVRRVPLGLVALVVAALALLAGESDRDPDVSSCHRSGESSAGLVLRSGAPALPIRASRPARRAPPRPADRTASRRSGAARRVPRRPGC